MATPKNIAGLLEEIRKKSGDAQFNPPEESEDAVRFDEFRNALKVMSIFLETHINDSPCTEFVAIAVRESRNHLNALKNYRNGDHSVLRGNIEAVRLSLEVLNVRIVPIVLVDHISLRVPSAAATQSSLLTKTLEEKSIEIDGRISSELKDFLTVAEAIQTRANSDHERAQQAETQLVKTLKSAQDQLAANTAAKNSKYFDDAAKNNKRSGLCWFLAVWIFVFLFAAVSYFLWSSRPPNYSVGVPWYVELVPYLTFRVVVYTGLLFGVTFCAKMYRSALVLEEANRHRSNALETFEFFRNSSDDVEIKKAILMKAVETAYAPTVNPVLTSDVELNSAAFLGEVIKKGTAGSK